MIGCLGGRPRNFLDNNQWLANPQDCEHTLNKLFLRRRGDLERVPLVGKNNPNAMTHLAPFRIVSRRCIRIRKNNSESRCLLNVQAVDLQRRAFSVLDGFNKKIKSPFAIANEVLVINKFCDIMQQLTKFGSFSRESEFLEQNHIINLVKLYRT
jgi:hypothetical protein